MSIIGHAFHSITKAVGSVFGSATNLLFPLAGPSFGSGSGSLWGKIIGSIDGLATGASAASGGTIANIFSGVKSLLGSGSSGFFGSLGSIFSGISSTIGSIGTSLNSVISPIVSTINTFTKEAQSFTDSYITPITSTLAKFESEYTSTINALQGDLHSGILGILKIPADISAALTSTDAQFQRAIQEMGTTNAGIAQTILHPALVDSIGGPLTHTSETIANYPFSDGTKAAFRKFYALDNYTTADELLDTIKGLEHEIESYGGIWAPLVHTLWNAMKAVAAFPVIVEQSLVGIEQSGRAQNPNTLLSPGEAVEAVRRGIIGDNAFQVELLKHGISPERQSVLKELAQFLFGPRDANELLQKGIIGRDEFDLLMSQNNLSSGQADALIALMEKLLGTGDILAAYARGLIDQDLRDRYLKAERVPGELWPVLTDLALTLTSPELMTRMQGRMQALEAGLLKGSLGSAPPKAISEQWDRAQQESSTAALAWLAHWQIPQASWWVEAYFRGIRTRTEVGDALTALNIPAELHEDVIAVEEELPPVWLVPDVVASGVWGEEQAVPTLQKLGFSKENASVLYQYGLSKSKSSKASTAADLAKVSLGNARTMYDDGLIDQGLYIQILLDHGYSQDAADLTAGLASFQLAQSQRKSQADLLLAEVKLGQITRDQAESRLYDLGFASGEVAAYLEKIEAAKVLAGKLPSEAQLDKLLTSGIIDASTWLDTMVLLGYSQTWAQRLLQLIH